MKFKSLIEEKRVLLLGPASYLKDKCCNIDPSNYDVVVKLNKMVEKPLLSESLNNRNDVLYHCIDINIPNGDTYDVKAWSEKNVGHLRIPMPPINHYYSKNISQFNKLNKLYQIKNSIIEPRTYMFVKNQCGTPPNTGTVAIYDLLVNNPKHLRIAGLTFCKTPYIEGYKEKIFYSKKRKSQHNHDKQLAFFAKLYDANHETIELDDELINILKRYK